MKLRDVQGWPPKEIQCAEQLALHFEPEKIGGLRIGSIAFIPGHRKPGDIVLVLNDQEKAVECSARLRLKDAALARRVLDTLESCKGLTLTQAGLRDLS